MEIGFYGGFEEPRKLKETTKKKLDKRRTRI